MPFCCPLTSTVNQLSSFVARLACEVGQNKGYKTTVYSDLRYEEEEGSSFRVRGLCVVLSLCRKGISMPLFRSDSITPY
jgi:hypothetical protein